MKLTLAIFLVVVLGNIFVVRALQCYVCAGPKTGDCGNGNTSSMVVQTCPSIPASLHSIVTGSFHASSHQTVCLSAVETNTVPDMSVRGCAILPADVDPCTFMKKFLPISACKYCSTDLCNVSEPSEDIKDVVINIL